MLYSLVYTSRAIRDYNRNDLLSLLLQARNRNKRLEITGMLLYTDSRFVQVLEGEEATVLSLYDDIRDDTRHVNVTTLVENNIDKRMFPDWTMGYKNIDLQHYRNIPGLNLFLDNEQISEPYRILLHFKDDPSCFQKDTI
ncbi:MAG: BLUF domain-containing protein [Proteobacteria bacterium]|nr:BLUF domain-containing protein [Pseudomonadota bacterium]NOG61041.1 BLUF domain-containing protein [Pseudomonadota bacterium]